MIIELLTSVPMPFNQEASVSKVNYLPRTLKESRYGVIHAYRAFRPTFDLSWYDKQCLLIMDGDEYNAFKIKGLSCKTIKDIDTLFP